MRRQRQRRFTNSEGYVFTFKDGKMIRHHRAVYAARKGPIPPGWHVHHKDGDKTNNRISNLVALPPNEHARLHSKDVRDRMKVQCRRQPRDERGRFIKGWLADPQNQSPP